MSLQLPRFVKKNSLEIERETFEKTQATSLSKAINSQENAVKEKHIRSAIIGTYQERGAQTFWECVHRIPLKENPILCWKFCHVLHKVLREGHERVLRDSQRYKPLLNEHGRFWSHLKTGGYGDLVFLYCTLLSTKLNFHMKNSKIPGDLNVDERVLIASTGGSEDALFSLAIEMFDYLDCIVDLQSHIFKTIESSKQSSMTNAGQCRLKPLIPCIQDAMLLYDYVTKIMFHLHEKLSPDLLNGHRDRFLKIFKGLQKFYEKTMSLQYFKNLLEIQNLPKYPPNFLVQSELQNYQPTRVTVLNDTADQPDSISEHLVSIDDTTSTNGSSPVPDAGVMALYMEKDRQVKDLEYQVEGLKLELERLKMQAKTQFQQMQFEIAELKQELLLKTQQLAEKEDQVKKLEEHECKIPPELVDRLEKSEALVKATEDKFLKMKDLYSKLSGEHVALLRKNAGAEKELMETKKAMNNQSELGIQLEELSRENAVLAETLQSKVDESKKEYNELNEIIHTLKSQLQDVENQKSMLQSTLITQVESKGKECHSLQEQIVKLKSQVQSVESSKALQEHDLKSSMALVTDELESLKVSKTFVEESNNALKGKLNDSEHRILELTKRLDETESSRDSLTMRVNNLSQQLENLLADELRNANFLLDQQLSKVSSIIKREVEDLENPRVGPEPGLRDFFMFHCEQFEDTIRALSDTTGKGFDSPVSLNNIVDQIQEFGHKVYFLLTYGGPLSRSGSDIQKGDLFLIHVKDFGGSTLDLLNLIKGRESVTLVAGFEMLRISWKKLFEMGKSLGLSLSPEADAAEILDSELHAMEQAIEDAARKMAEMLSKSRASHTGVKLEVNEKLIDSCASLMEAIRLLVQRSKGLQLEIVAQGRGTASAKEFYKRNNQWTEGLISAAKAVGIGAKLLLESADKAVTSKDGSFEYLIASSQEIAASTIQLVVASQVRADRSSTNLSLVKQASTGVKTATANVVATAKDCAQLIEESDEIDMTKLSPHQSKRLELELLAEMLRQEAGLEKSRRKLSSLRQHNYHNTEG